MLPIADTGMTDGPDRLFGLRSSDGSVKRTPERLLVFRIGQIGDTIATLPSLWALRQQFPDARMIVLSEIPPTKTHLPLETVLPNTGLVDGYVKYPGGASARHFLVAWRQVRQLRKRGFDTLVYLAPSGRTKRQLVRDRMFFRLTGIRQLLAFKGFVKDRHPRSPDGALTPLPKEADALLERLREDGLQVPRPGQGSTALRITETEHQRARHWWRQNGSPQTPHGWVAICSGGKVRSKLWPWERYCEVVRLLIEQHGIFPVIIGGAEDRELGKKLLASWGTGLCSAGELTVRESAALMEGARFYLGNDTGAMHLASAVGIPCVAIFSARDWPGIWEPYGIGHKVLRFDVPCSGCRVEVCDKELKCLRGIQTQQVYQACVEMIARQRG
jgi:heptosyltransferase III